MNNHDLIKLSLIISLIGILFLLFLTNFTRPKPIEIKNINSQMLNQKIQIQGDILSIRTYKQSDFQIITLKDNTGKIDITLNPIINITKNQTIRVIGKITEYKDNLQISADKIIQIS